MYSNISGIWKQSYPSTNIGGVWRLEYVPKLMLYNNGDYCSSITGGWSTQHMDIYSNWPYARGTVYLESNRIVMKSLSTPEGGVTGVHTPLATINKIPLAGYSKLCLDIDITVPLSGDDKNKQYAYLRAPATTAYGGSPSLSLPNDSTGRRTLTLNISSVYDSRYICIDNLYGLAHTTAYNQVNYVYSVWLE